VTDEIDARERALLALYEADQRNGAVDADLPEGRMKRLVTGVIEESDSLDATLDAASERWRIRRMPAVDRAVLRLGLYELRHETDTPTAVILAEAVRLAKKYSTQRSGAFVNGLLAAVAGAARPDDPASVEV
jgi:N utilization substance protein B